MKLLSFITPANRFNFMAWTYAAILALGVSTSNASKEGVSTGNGSFITGLRMVLSDQHPNQSELMQLIEKAKLPSSLREAILADLSSVSILYSDETITANDLRDKINWEVVSSKKIRTENNGKVSEKTITESQARREANEYGLHYHSLTEILSKVSNPQLAAITSVYENKVIYFNPSLQQLNKEQQHVLTLHEQGHRLVSLFGHRKTNDERFIEAWAQAFYNYLVGRMPSDEFYRLLERNGVSTFTPADAGKLCQLKCFTTEQLVNSAAATFESQVSIIVKPQHIRMYGPSGNNGFVLVLDPSAFQNYPIIANEKEIYIYMEATGQAGYDLVSALVDRARTNASGEVMHFRVNFKRVVAINNETNLAEQRVTLNQINLSTEDFSNQLALLRETAKPYFSKIEIARTETPFVLLDPEIRLITQDGLGRLILWMSELSKNSNFARELKYLNAKRPIAISIDPLSDTTTHICERFNTTLENNHCYKSWGVEEYLEMNTSIGLKGLTSETLSRINFGIPVRSSFIAFASGGGVTAEQVRSFAQAPEIVDLMNTLYQPSGIRLELGFLAESEYDIEITAKVMNHLGIGYYFDTTAYDYIRRSVNAIVVRVSRQLRNSPAAYAQAVRSVLLDRKNYRFDNSKMYIHGRYTISNQKNLRVKKHLKNYGYNEVVVDADIGANFYRGLGLE